MAFGHSFSKKYTLDGSAIAAMTADDLFAQAVLMVQDAMPKYLSAARGDEINNLLITAQDRADAKDHLAAIYEATLVEITANETSRLWRTVVITALGGGAVVAGVMCWKKHKRHHRSY